MNTIVIRIPRLDRIDIVAIREGAAISAMQGRTSRHPRRKRKLSRRRK